jgi:glycosyltransferase involved in cell wall biosynthesis
MSATVSGSPPPRLTVVHEGDRDIRLDFIRAHVERLPFRTQLVHGFIPSVEGQTVLSGSVGARIIRRADRFVRRAPWDDEITKGYLSAFRQFGTDVVLAEWGPVAVRVMDACARLGIPLVAHFHGYDASVYRVVNEYRAAYLRLFERATAIVAVSRDMCRRLRVLGAPEGKLRYNTYGVDVEAFVPGPAGVRPPVFVAVGRFTEKKAPNLTIEAFARTRRDVPDVRLVMVGDGPLLEPCRVLAKSLNVEDAIDFAGLGNRTQIIARLAQARAFVQHSVVAPDGDAEGTPNVVLEAGAMALPVVSTRHAGIPDVVVEGETGWLVDELDVEGMSRHMTALAHDGAQALRMGLAARRRIEQHFTVEQSMRGLTTILENAIASRAHPADAG